MRIIKDETELPTEINQKYYFVLGMVIASIELKLIPQESDFFKAFAAFLEANQESRTEIKLLQDIREYQSLPYEPPF